MSKHDPSEPVRGFGHWVQLQVDRIRERRRQVAAGEVPGLIICKRCDEAIADAEEEICELCVREIASERARSDALEAWRRGDEE